MFNVDVCFSFFYFLLTTRTSLLITFLHCYFDVLLSLTHTQAEDTNLPDTLQDFQQQSTRSLLTLSVKTSLTISTHDLDDEDLDQFKDDPLENRYAFSCGFCRNINAKRSNVFRPICKSPMCASYRGRCNLSC